MASGFDPIYDPTYGELMSVIRRVRLRWRMKVALRGLVTLIVTGFAAFAVSVWGMDYFLYSERAVEVFRWLAYLTLIALAVRLLAIPLARRVSTRQVALYVEENEPTLKASVLSAVELGPVQQGSPADAERVSPELQRQVLEDAIERCQQSGFATRIERGALQRFSAALPVWRAPAWWPYCSARLSFSTARCCCSRPGGRRPSTIRTAWSWRRGT